MSNRHAVVLLSGGLDSSVGLAVLKQQGWTTRALFVDYGQRSAGQESNAAQHITAHFGDSLYLAHLDELGRMLAYASALTSDDRVVPQGERFGFTDCYVPARNAMLLLFAAAHAESFALTEIGQGGQIDELAVAICTLPTGGYTEGHRDLGEDFCNAVEQVINLGSRLYAEHQLPIQVLEPFRDTPKSDVVLLGSFHGVPLERTYTCYAGTVPPCGTCSVCVERSEAFETAAATSHA